MASDMRVPAGWRMVRLGELGEVNRGRSRHRPRYAEHLYGGPYPFIQTGDVKASGGLITQHTQTYSEAGLAQSRLWPAGTMCITIAANIAETGILTYPACFPDSVVGFIADEAVCDTRFIEYTFRQLRKRIQNEATGSVQDNINLGTLERLLFPLPPLPEQRRIAHILGTLDDKIELNRRMNETLEAMAQALFKSWFVDFDPVLDKALAAGNPIPDAFADRAAQRADFLNGNLPSPCGRGAGGEGDYLALFPDRFTDSELGPIPEGWEAGTLGSLAELNPESWSAKRHPESVEYVDLANTKDGVIESAATYTFAEAPSRARRVLRLGDTIVGTVRPGNRSFAFVHRDGLTGSTGFAVLRPRQLEAREFVYLATSQDETIDRLAQLADGAAYPAVRPDVVADQPCCAPDNGVLRVFSVQTKLVFDLHRANQEESANLATMRDILLPQLLKGDISPRRKTGDDDYATCEQQ